MPVDTVDAKADSGDIETQFQDWIDTTTFTSIDDFETVQIGSNRVVITIKYTA